MGMRGSSSSRYHSFIREAERDMTRDFILIKKNFKKKTIKYFKFKNQRSPGTLGSERFSGILHWSTWSFSAFTSSISPGTLWIKSNPTVTTSSHKRDLYFYSAHSSCLVAKPIPHAHPVGLKCGLVTLALFAVVAWNNTKTEYAI